MRPSTLRKIYGLKARQKNGISDEKFLKIISGGQTGVDRGALDVGKAAGHYVPELARGGYGTVTLDRLLDMRSGVKYSENYADPRAEFFDFDAKYKGCGTEHHFDTDLPAQVLKACQDLAKKANKVVGARDLARIDIMLDDQQRSAGSCALHLRRRAHSAAPTGICTSLLRRRNSMVGSRCASRPRGRQIMISTMAMP